MKTILTTLFSVSILATMAIAGPGCSGYKEVTLAEQKSHAHEVLVVEIDGMELFQLTNQEGKIFFKISGAEGLLEHRVFGFSADLRPQPFFIFIQLQRQVVLAGLHELHVA